MKATKLTAHAQYHVTCTQGVPQNHTSQFFWPRIVYSLYNFYGATTTIKGSFILEHPHVKAIFGRKSSQNRSPKWQFFGNLGLRV